MKIDLRECSYCRSRFRKPSEAPGVGERSEHISTIKVQNII
ncbi:MAG: hypothetical protein ACE5PV_05190 [Candidatus Poribacteria bacterium]